MRKEVKNYQEQVNITKNIVKIYQKLAELEKENDIGEEYQGWFSLLERAIEIEEKSYQEDITVLSELAKKSINKKFVTFEDSLEVLCDIRSLNLTSKEKIYALEGNVFKENKPDEKDKIEEIPVEALCSYSPIDISVSPKPMKKAQMLIDEIFYKRLCYVLKNVEITEKERNILIETKYALLSTSKTLENKFIKGDLRDFLPLTLSKDEKNSFTLNLVSKMKELEERVLDIKDATFDQENAIAQLVYIDAFIVNMHPTYAGVISYEFVNATRLNRILGMVEESSRDKICDLIDQIFIHGYLSKKENKLVEKK